MRASIVMVVVAGLSVYALAGSVHAAEIRKNGVLVIDGENATLTLRKEEKDASSNAVSTSMNAAST